jgi:hypothetical protein
MTPRFTATDRLTAFTELERFSTDIAELDDGVAYDEFWGEQWDKADELDETLTALSSGAFDMWFWLDRPLADGRLVVDCLLVENPTLQPGVRHYLELARETCMRLYEVIDLRPGVSVTLRDVMDDAAVAVHEKRASRQLRRADLLAARVIRYGISGQPEMEAGVLNFSPLMRESIVTQLSSHREEFRRERHGTGGIAFYKEMVPFFHFAWLIAHLDPPRLRLRGIVARGRGGPVARPLRAPLPKLARRVDSGARRTRAARGCEGPFTQAESHRADPWSGGSLPECAPAERAGL